MGPDGMLTATEVSIKGSSIEVGTAHPLNIPVVTSAFYLYDVSPDGQRFLVAAPRDQAAEPVTLVSNWVQMLKKK